MSVRARPIQKAPSTNRASSRRAACVPRVFASLAMVRLKSLTNLLELELAKCSNSGLAIATAVPNSANDNVMVAAPLKAYAVARIFDFHLSCFVVGSLSRCLIQSAKSHHASPPPPILAKLPPQSFNLPKVAAAPLPVTLFAPYRVTTWST